MAKGDVNYLESNNIDCTVEDGNGNNQRGILTIPAPGVVQDVAFQDQTTPPVEYFLTRVLNAVVITSTQLAKTNTITLQAGHAVVIGDLIEIYNEEIISPEFTLKRFAQLRVVSVATNVIRFGSFIGFDTSPATIQFSNRTSFNMNVVGTLDVPVRFRMGPPNGFKWDLTRTILAMILEGQPDDSDFGDQDALTNGIFFGFEGDLVEDYLVNILSNAGFRGTAYDVNYIVRSQPAGSWGLSMRKSFSGADKYGVVIRLEGENNDEFVMYIQDDLSDIIEFGVKVMGHIVDD